jgi:acyl-[acyl-carrier-protein] desaturase
VDELIRFWGIEALTGLDAIGREAQAKILDIPRRLTRVADHMESRTRAKTFSFDLVFHREFAMD